LGRVHQDAVHVKDYTNGVRSVLHQQPILVRPSRLSTCGPHAGLVYRFNTEHVADPHKSDFPAP
jgi:hypothetical protein